MSEGFKINFVTINAIPRWCEWFYVVNSLYEVHCYLLSLDEQLRFVDRHGYKYPHLDHKPLCVASFRQMRTNYRSPHLVPSKNDIHVIIRRTFLLLFIRLAGWIDSMNEWDHWTDEWAKHSRSRTAKEVGRMDALMSICPFSLFKLQFKVYNDVGWLIIRVFCRRILSAYLSSMVFQVEMYVWVLIFSTSSVIKFV